MEELKTLPDWFYWAFGGAGPVLVGLIYHFFKPKKEETLLTEKHQQTSASSQVEINNNPQIIINNGSSMDKEAAIPAGEKMKSSKKKFDSIEVAKSQARLLFIDDDTRFKMVKNLKEAGWLTVNIKKDIHTDDALLKMADLVFVDINGVGKKMDFSNEGLGLSTAIREQYPDKYIVIYSSETNGNRFDDAIRKADYSLDKNSDAYQFEKCIKDLLVR